MNFSISEEGAGENPHILGGKVWPASHTLPAQPSLGVKLA
jgi:hypothetical protein